MTDKPLFDRAALEDIVSTAQAQRVRHLGNAWQESSKGVRWSGLGVVLAWALAVLGAQYVSGAHAGNGYGSYNQVAKR
jgi:hypothetical protein